MSSSSWGILAGEAGASGISKECSIDRFQMATLSRTEDYPELWTCTKCGKVFFDRQNDFHAQQRATHHESSCGTQ
ncbi:MAG: hypothetical protein ACYCPP_04875 [Nitrososphaerales archaeon]